MANRWCIVIKQAGSRLKRCDDEAMAGQCDCDWPGNNFCTASWALFGLVRKRDVIEKRAKLRSK